ncbi:hypothetical protein BS47DRAFT_80486 [Hydnum rufescens UP504]|uniref:General stress protein FMN-binding split barrel domain-containing protein n=1 Tax=Hydnum rufescens UP504 TaxID=1448309 RepID=A0A9P6DZ77_9AGAM|nr:hypothetical protein BS47DRAFT_80486 [Hydnum rufescens UP504]
MTYKVLALQKTTMAPPTMASPEPYIHPTANMTLQQKVDGMHKVIKAAKSSMLTTCGTDGSLHSRAMTPASYESLHFTYIANNTSSKFDDLEHNSHVNVSFFDPDTTELDIRYRNSPSERGSFARREILGPMYQSMVRRSRRWHAQGRRDLIPVLVLSRLFPTKSDTGSSPAGRSRRPWTWPKTHSRARTCSRRTTHHHARRDRCRRRIAARSIGALWLCLP